ncbi:MAG: sensor histidine kinase, partial [Burkholderiaceae bacterium]
PPPPPPPDSAAERAEALAGVMRGVDKAAHLLDQLLDLARSESLALSAGSGSACTDAGRALAHVRAELDAEIARRRLRVDVESSPAARPRCSEPGLVLLLRNLLANAVRYTPEGGAVAVRIMQGDAGVTIQVDDSGPGIPPERRQRAFERFERLGRQDDTGVGLGMAIVQSVAAAHGATVRLLDSPLGGLRVEVFFPVAVPSSFAMSINTADRHRPCTWASARSSACGTRSSSSASTSNAP